MAVEISLHSAFRNPTATKKRYSFFPDRIVNIEAGEIHYHPGSLETYLAQHPKLMQTYQDALSDGTIEKLHDAGPILFDETEDAPIQLGVDDGELIFVDPSWLGSA